MRVRPRLEKLEGLLPMGCVACRSWCGTVLVDDAGAGHRPERCPGCGRSVPIRSMIHIVGVPLDAL